MLGPHDPRSPSSFPPPRCGHSFIFPRAVGAERTWQEPTSAPEGQAQCSLLFLFLLTPPATPPYPPRAQGSASSKNVPSSVPFSHGYMSFLSVILPVCPQIPALGMGAGASSALTPAVGPSSAPTPRKPQRGPHPGGSPANNNPLPRKQWGACSQFWGASAALNGS